MDIDPQYRTDDGSALRIFRDAVQNNYLTERAGRPIFDEALYVEVISPGSRGSTPVFEVKRFYAEEMGREPKIDEMHYTRYKRFIDDFESKENNPDLKGTPITEWPEISRSLAATLRGAEIFTVDTLANLSDTRLATIGPDGRQWRDKAKAFLAAAADGAVATRLAAENAQLRTDIETRDETIATLAARITALEQGSVAPQPADPEPADPEPAKPGKPGKAPSDII